MKRTFLIQGPFKDMDHKLRVAKDVAKRIFKVNGEVHILDVLSWREPEYIAVVELPEVVRVLKNSVLGVGEHGSNR